MAKRADTLLVYRKKRNFSVSPEPAGKSKASKGKHHFCVQKHLASHLHYDFRLEHAGVLLSWAVPKGPSLNPRDKRLAIRTEDHPIDYGDFEGVIPEGYGAGIVMLWDAGTWRCESRDIDAALEQGELKFSLDGVKLKGSWVLVRTRRSATPEQWLLIKHRDEWAGDVDVAKRFAESVKSFTDFPEILKNSGKLDALTNHPPVKGGDAGKLLQKIIDAAREEKAPVRKAKKPPKHPQPAVACSQRACSRRPREQARGYTLRMK